MVNSNKSNFQGTNRIKNKLNGKLDLTESMSDTMQVFGDVEFGMLSEKCRKFGICRIEERSELNLNVEYDNKKNKPGAYALLTLSLNGQVELAFFKANLNEATAKLFFGSGKFIVGEDYIYPSTSESVLPSFKIKKGTYSVVDTLDFLKVTFKK